MTFLNKKNIFTIPNYISSFRLFLGIFLFFYFISEPNYQVVKNIFIVSIIIAYFSDILDGFIARKTNNISEFGKIIDPIADKIFVFVLVFVLFISDFLSGFLFYAIISRDILILFGSLFFMKKKNFVIPSNYLGKFTVFLTGIYLLSLFFQPNYSLKIRLMSEIIIFCLLLASLIKYFLDAMNLVKKGK